MRLGIITPVVTLNPRAHNPWEVDATVDDLVAVARAADDLGYHHLTCSEHVAIPASVAAGGQRGARYWDPLATLSYLAAATRRIRLATHVLVLGYHHPLQIVKRYSTLDRLSGGRLILGVGVGSLEPEFALLGALFAGRGARADESLVALRGAFGRPEIDGFVLDPVSVQAPPPIWVGGRTARSLRRALAHGDGWVPFGLSPEEIGALLARARSSPEWARRREPFDVLVWPEPPVDPIRDPGGFEQAMARATEAGATIVNLRFRSNSLAHHLDQMAAAAALPLPFEA